MNLYNVSWSDEDGHAQKWAGSLREAKLLRAEVRAECGDPKLVVGIDPVVIHTNKNGLIAWLNINFNRNNG